MKRILLLIALIMAHVLNLFGSSNSSESWRLKERSQVIEQAVQIYPNPHELVIIERKHA